VFWVLFQAKSSGNGSDDANTYIQVRLQTSSHSVLDNDTIYLPQHQTRTNKLPPPTGQQPPMGRYIPNGINGVPQRGPPPNAPMPNGVPGPSTIPPAAPGPMPNGESSISMTDDPYISLSFTLITIDFTLGRPRSV